MSEIDSCAEPDVSRVLVGNMADLEGSRQVTREDGAALAERYQIPFFETSARDGTNVTEAFTALAERMVIKFFPSGFPELPVLPVASKAEKKCSVA
jgi:GTPase SAR1 family protein